MADYVEVNGVSMWYDERGDGDPLVLLHGGLSDSRDFTGNLDTLASRFRLLLPERRGHGHTADVAGPITLEVMAQDTIAFLDKVVGGPVRLVGYSAGATVALRVAVGRPDLVDRLVLISGAFHRDGMILRPTADAAPPPQLVAAYAEVSPDGAEHLPVVIAKIAQSVAEEPGLTAADLGAVARRTLVMVGDDDNVTLEHTLALYRGLRNAQLAIVPAASHLLLLEKPELCTRLVSDFLTTDSTPTMMPIRRATHRPPPTERHNADLAQGRSDTQRITASLQMDVSRRAYEETPPMQAEQRDHGDWNLPAGLPKPAQRALAAAGYTRLEQLTNVSETDLQQLHGVGPKALEQLRRALAACGLSFARRG